MRPAADRHPIAMLPEPSLAIAASQPRPRFPFVPAAVVVASALLSSVAFSDISDGATRAVAWVMALLVTVGVVALSVAWAQHLSAKLREEGAVVRQAEEAQRLGRPDVAASLLGRVLANTMVSPVHRLQALGTYVAALARGGRYEEAVGAADAMMSEGVPPELAVRLRSAKVYALLREDRLADADRALGELRRMGREGPVGAALALAEAYRDVRTGHGADLLEAHPAMRELVARFLGARVGDIEALAAWARHRAGDLAGARRHWRRATLLQPVPELLQRYPELAPVASAIPAEPIPGELR